MYKRTEKQKRIQFQGIGGVKKEERNWSPIGNSLAAQLRLKTKFLHKNVLLKNTSKIYLWKIPVKSKSINIFYKILLKEKSRFAENPFVEIIFERIVRKFWSIDSAKRPQTLENQDTLVPEVLSNEIGLFWSYVTAL